MVTSFPLKKKGGKTDVLNGKDYCPNRKPIEYSRE
jgi:hypothetical protein